MPAMDDAHLTILTGLRDDLKSFREELKRDMESLVTKAVFESEMKRRDDQVAALQSGLDREANARKTFADGLANERRERQNTVRWIVGFIGTPVAALTVTQFWQAVTT